ncbi:MAG: hypothetical protein J6I85_05825 [Clostridia bacterium]|nr:hypothetical protein [Clostridia bacterium]
MGVISSLGMALSSLRGIMNTLSNENLSAGEKFIQVTSALAITIPMLINSFKGLNKDMALSIGLWLKNAFSTETYALASNKAALSNGALAISEAAVLWPLAAILAAIIAVTAALLIWAHNNEEVIKSH